VPDTDDEFYDVEESEDSDASDDSNTSSSKDKKPATASVTQPSQPSSTQSGQLKRRHSDTDEDEKDVAKHTKIIGSVHDIDSSAVDTVAMDCGQVKLSGTDNRSDADADDATQNKHSDTDAVAKNHAKLEDGTTKQASDINSHGMCCVLTSHDDHST